MTTHEISELLTVTAPAVARELSTLTGETWTTDTPEEPQHFRHLRRGDGAEVSLSLRDYPQPAKFSAYGNFPNSDCAPRSEDRVTVHLASTKAPAQIAKDIARRLLPTYLPQYAEAVQSHQRTLAAVARGQAAAEALARALGEPVPQERNWSREWTLFRYETDGMSLRAHISPDYSQNGRHIKLELSNLTLAEAKAVVTVMRGKTP